MRTWTLFLTVVFALVGAAFGSVIGLTDLVPNVPHKQPPLEYPLPHHIPKYAGGVSLRFAMVHDVLHERYPRHGTGYYEARNQLVRAQMKKPVDPNDPRSSMNVYFALNDDLGAGLDYLKQDDKAVEVLKDKLSKQETLGYTGRQLYTSYANLGTFLIHGNFAKAMRGDAAAKEGVREGLAFIHKSMEVNPEAHFGREIWQAVTAEFLLAALEKPGLLLQYDIVGNRLDRQVNPTQERSLKDAEKYGLFGANRDVTDLLNLKAPQDLRYRLRYQYIKHVGAEEGWNESVATSHRAPVPFDEPTLGIIGMWRLGGGANPHFALALGEIMMRVGQRYIAWCAYERAIMLAERFWPNPNIQARFVEHCLNRQAIIEDGFPPSEVKELRPRFTAELAYGQGYQKAYQDFEAKRIKQGATLDDSSFYDAFFAQHGQIASALGEADKFVVKPTWQPRLNMPSVVLFAGVFAFAGACILRLIYWLKRR